LRTPAGFRIFAIGGYASSDATASPVGTVEEFDPASNRWRAAQSLITPVAEFGVTVAGGNQANEPLRIHVVSGNTGSETAPSLTNASLVQVFPDATTGGWQSLNPAITPRRLHGVASVLRGVSARVFVLGGVADGGATLDTVEEYRAADGVAVNSPHTAMPSPRARSGISRSLSTNQIYVIGGQDNTGQEMATVFEYTVANNGPRRARRARQAEPGQHVEPSSPPEAACRSPLLQVSQIFFQCKAGVGIRGRTRSSSGFGKKCARHVHQSRQKTLPPRTALHSSVKLV
jgi:hypothetical protein